MMLKEKSHDFVEWREEFVSRERGSRVVQYYLEDSSGESHLAVVGTERSLRHMFYAITEFCHEYGADSCLKWRSKREVVDWLSSFISPRQGSQKNDSLPKTGADITADRVTSPGTCLHKPLNQPSRNLRSHKSDITWTGDSWTCGKLLRHYKALCRNGTMITIYHCGQPTKQETSVLLFRYIGEESVERCRLVMGKWWTWLFWA